MGFAERLYDLRNNYQMSQAQLAEELNVSRQTVSKWELGAAFPEIDKLIKISDLYHVSIDYLLKESNPQEERETLDRLVLTFLGSAQDMDHISKEFVDIMRDGIIDRDERVRVNEILIKLGEISEIIDGMKKTLEDVL